MLWSGIMKAELQKRMRWASTWPHAALSGGVPGRALGTAVQRLCGVIRGEAGQQRMAQRYRIVGKRPPRPEERSGDTKDDLYGGSEDLSKCFDRVHSGSALSILRQRGLSEQLVQVM